MYNFNYNYKVQCSTLTVTIPVQCTVHDVGEASGGGNAQILCITFCLLLHIGFYLEWLFSHKFMSHCIFIFPLRIMRNYMGKHIFCIAA